MPASEVPKELFVPIESGAMTNSGKKYSSCKQTYLARSHVCTLLYTSIHIFIYVCVCVCVCVCALDSFVEFENCRKMHICLQSSVPIHPPTGGSLLKFCCRRRAVRLSGGRDGAP